MKKLLSLSLSFVLLLSFIVAVLPANAETVDTKTYSITILNKTDAVISNNAVEIKQGNSYSTTISIKDKNQMGEIKVGVIMDDGTIVEPNVVDDYTLSVNIPQVTGNLNISAYTASKSTQSQTGNNGYGEIVRVLENVVSDKPNVKYYGCEDIYLPNGSFYFEEHFTPKDGYEITEFKAVNTCAYLYDTVNHYGEPVAKGYKYTEQNMLDQDSSNILTKNDDGSYTLKYMPSGSVFVKVIAEKKATSPKLSASSISLNAGKTQVLKVIDGTAKVWTTSNNKVAKIKDGKVTAIDKGTATITATLTTGEKLTCQVTVKNSPRLTASKVVVKSGNTKTIKAVGGTVATWKTSKKNIVTVKNGKITALNKGSAKVIATLTTGKTLSCKVTVTTGPKLYKNTVNVKRVK